VLVPSASVVLGGTTLGMGGLMVRVLLTCWLAVVASATAGAQHRTIKDSIVGTWSLDSVTAELADGRKTEPFGPQPKGIMIFTADGHFSLFQSRAELPKISANDRAKATPDEAAALVSGAIAYYGTYSVNEDEKSLSVTLDGSTFQNLLGPPQKRIVTSIDAKELKFANPRTPSGMTLQTEWKRAQGR